MRVIREKLSNPELVSKGGSNRMNSRCDPVSRVCEAWNEIEYDKIRFRFRKMSKFPIGIRKIVIVLFAANSIVCYDVFRWYMEENT